ncbi:DUF4362 domain-containing protein [Bacillus taeanensis]|uniref:DUF4362 domain-containing protein n=1 Tax=Bacillus taeanensis TaxID=273032 RepID=A0A366XYM3_9BACI|nr:DUF4362 domain-containing protein [Bacillus taeanensis]RBW69849.1 hypothetical protein DS031_10000 [Bacillus taeanensis]
MLNKVQLFVFCLLILLSAAGCGTEKEINSRTKTTNKKEPSTNDIISMHGNVENLEALDEFIEEVNNNHPSSIRIVKYTIEGDPIYHELTYEKEKIQFQLDTTKDGYGPQEVTTETCKDLIRTQTKKELIYTLKNCTGEWNNFELLYVPYDVEK